MNVANPSSGAIMAGAGNPPSGTHGFAQYGGDVLVDRARCNFSNYGARVDARAAQARHDDRIRRPPR